MKKVYSAIKRFALAFFMLALAIFVYMCVLGWGRGGGSGVGCVVEGSRIMISY